MHKYQRDFGFLELSDDGKLYRCRHCAEYKHSAATFGIWRPYLGIKRSNLVDHQKSCKGLASTNRQPTMKRMFETMAVKDQATRDGIKEEIKQGVVLQFAALGLICNQEMALAKRGPLLKYADVVAKSPLPPSDNWRGKNYGAVQLQFLSYAIRDRALAGLRNGAFYGLILDESTDVSMTKTLCCLANTDYGSKFLGVVQLNSGTGQSIAMATCALLAKLGVPLETCVAVGSDGASAMVGVHNGMIKHFSDKVAEARGLRPGRQVLYQVHCTSHRLALAVDDVYNDPRCKVFLHEVDALCRAAYSFFSRSSSNRVEYKALCDVWGKEARLPTSLIETRWIGRYRCIAVLSDCREQVLRFIESNYYLRYTGEGQLVSTFFRERGVLFGDLRRILKIVAILSQQTQVEGLTVWRCFTIIEKTSNRLEFLSGLSDAGKVLRKVFLEHLRKRLSLDSAKIFKPFEFLQLKIRGAKFPKADVMRSISHVVKTCKPLLGQGDKAVRKRFYRDFRLTESYALREKISCILKAVLEAGVSPAFLQLIRAVISVPASSAGAERTFSCQNRVKSKYRSCLSVRQLDRLMAVRLLSNSRDVCSTEDLDRAFERWWAAKDRRRKQASDAPIRQRTANVLTDNVDLEDDDSCDEDFEPESDVSDVSFESDDDTDSDGAAEPLASHGADWGGDGHGLVEEAEDDLSDGWESDVSE